MLFILQRNLHRILRIVEVELAFLFLLRLGHKISNEFAAALQSDRKPLLIDDGVSEWQVFGCVQFIIAVGKVIHQHKSPFQVEYREHLVNGYPAQFLHIDDGCQAFREKPKTFVVSVCLTTVKPLQEKSCSAAHWGRQDGGNKAQNEGDQRDP